MPQRKESPSARGHLRDKILDSAVEILRKRGIKQLTQPRVAKAAGIPQGHLTYYFPRRADLLAAVAERSAEWAFAELGQALAREAFPRSGAVQDQVLALTAYLVKNRERTRILLSLLVEADDDPRLRPVLLEHVARIRRLVAAAIGRAESDPNVDVALSALWGLSLQHLLYAGHRSDEYTDELLRRLPRFLESDLKTVGGKT